MHNTSTLVKVAVVVCTVLLSVIVINLIGTSDKSYKSTILSHKPAVPVIVLQQSSELAFKPVRATHINNEDLYLIIKENGSLYLFTKLEQLEPYDRNNDNIIDGSDPLFQKLYVGHYDDKKHILTYRPIDKTAIRAIEIERDNHKKHVVRARALYANTHGLSHQLSNEIIQKRIIKDDFEHLIIKPIG